MQNSDAGALDPLAIRVTARETDLPAIGVPRSCACASPPDIAASIDPHQFTGLGPF
jgi:hypothetical protein